MRTKYKFINFTKSPTGKVWYCNNNRSEDQLGAVEYYKRWRCWVFSSSGYAMIFNSSCLRDIAEFMDELKKGNGDKNET